MASRQSKSNKSADSTNIHSDKPIQSLDILRKIQTYGNEETFSDLITKIEYLRNRLKTYPERFLNDGASVYAIDAPWGAGKTTFVKVVEDEIMREDSKNWFAQAMDFLNIPHSNGHTIWINFDPWNFSNSTELVENFFETLDYERGKYYGKGLGSSMRRYVDLVSVDYEASNGFNAFRIHAQKKLSGPQPLRLLKEDIKGRLQNVKEKIVIVLDDLDRMDPDEVMVVLKLVKMVSDFPRIIFILPMDYHRVSRIIVKSSKYGETYKNYLQKIVQQTITIKPYSYDELQAIFLWLMNSFCDDEEYKRMYVNLFSIYLESLINQTYQKTYHDAQFYYEKIPIPPNTVNPYLEDHQKQQYVYGIEKNNLEAKVEKIIRWNSPPPEWFNLSILQEGNLGTVILPWESKMPSAYLKDLLSKHIVIINPRDIKQLAYHASLELTDSNTVKKIRIKSSKHKQIDVEQSKRSIYHPQFLEKIVNDVINRQVFAVRE